MPQLDPTTFAPQLIWLAITFIGLYVLMARVALPRIGGMIEQRRDRIASDLDEAARLKDDTEKAIADYETALAEARARAHTIAQQTRDELKAATDRERASLDQSIAKKLAEAEARIADARDAAMADVATIATGLAGDIVTSLAGASPTPAALERAVKAAADG